MADRIYSGMLRHVVTIQSRADTRTTTGGFTTAWTAVDTRKAAVNSVTGRKYYEAMQTETERAVTVIMRYYDGLTTKSHRILFGSRAFNIKHIAVMDEVEQWMVLLCQEDGA